MLTTSNIPHHLLASAYVVGTTPFFSFSTDPRISYSLFIPPEHYPLAKAPTKLPLIVTIHGTRRRVEASRDALKDLAISSRAAVLAPLFPAGLDGPNDLSSYRLFRPDQPGFRADLVLLGILDEVSVRWPGIDTSQVFLVGFSGGAQFTQRFLYMHPERVFAGSVGSPGNRISLREVKEEWQHDENEEKGQKGWKFDSEALKAIREVQLVVGGDDTEVPAKDLFQWMNKMGMSQPVSKEVGRREGMEELYSEWKDLGVKVRMDIIDGVKHESARIWPNVVTFLDPLLEEWWEGKNVTINS